MALHSDDASLSDRNTEAKPQLKKGHELRMAFASVAASANVDDTKHGD